MMIVSLYLPIVALALFAIAGPIIGVRLPPASGVRLLTIVAAVATAGYVWSLVLIAGTLIDDVPSVWGHRTMLPVPDSIGLVAAALLAVGLLQAGLATRNRRHLHRELREACADVDDDLVVLPDPRPQAFTVPGKPGRIVVSQGMLRVLSPGHRRVLLAHEREHLEGRHSALLAVVRTAAAINPALVPLSRVVSFLCERSADEAAAQVVGDRRLAAQALAVAALASATPTASVVPTFHGHAVRRRVVALQAPPPIRAHRLVIAFTAAFCGTVLVADLVATDELIALLSWLLPF